MLTSCPWQQSWAAGDAAILLEFGTSIDELTNDRVHDAARAIQAAQVPGIWGLVPAYSTLLIQFDPEVTRRAEVLARIEALAYGQSRKPPRRFLVPVCYGGEWGPDLDDVASRLGLSPEAVIAHHTRQDYRIYCIGFSPGFPLCGVVPPAIETPRRSSPRTKVPRGSVAIAGRQTGVYPTETPGGWHLLGRTPAPLFRLEDRPPVPYQPGDRIQFYAIDAKVYEQLAQAAASGQWTLTETLDATN